MSESLTLTVRMYRMGLGDCFLLIFTRNQPGGRQKKFHMLIDCGMYQGSANFSTRLTEVVKHIRDDTGGTIDLLAITHEHFDHVSGFSNGNGLEEVREIWASKAITIRRLWMAWTEGESDQACALRAKRHEAAGVLKKLLNSFKDPEIHAAAEPTDRRASEPAPAHSLKRSIEELLGFAGIFGTGDTDDNNGADGGASVGLTAPAEAMEFIKGLAEEATFHYPREKVLTLPELAGVRFYILGPPANEQLLYSDPRKGEAYENETRIGLGEAFYNALEQLQQRQRLYNLVKKVGGWSAEQLAAEKEQEQEQERTGDPNPFADYPFAQSVGLPIDQALLDGQPALAKPVESKAAPQEAFLLEAFCAAYVDEAQRWRRIDNDWQSALSDLALALDGDTNNTSLAIAIELVESGQVLIFPGDAQAGNWRSWGSGPWAYRDTDGHEQTVTLEGLLERTVLYKVGHHGSHNATRRDPGLEQMGKRFGLTALIPTDEQFARNKGENGWQMPFGPLYRRLLQKTGGRIIRADHGLPTRDADGIKLDPVSHQYLYKSLKITDAVLTKFLKTITLSDADWSSFVDRARAGPNDQNPLYYEIDILG